MSCSCLVSVIIPVYNVKPYLVEALDSVVNQTYKNLEIIIVDDGSTDGSGEICDRYSEKDMRITVIHHENRGLSIARNEGLDIMTGEVVAFLDSDDMYHPDYIRIMCNTLIKENADIAVCKCTRTRKKPVFRTLRGRNRKKTLLSREDALRAQVEGAIGTAVWSKVYRRELWQNIRFPVGCESEDIATTFRVIDACGKLCMVDRKLYYYRNRADSLTGIATWKGYCDWRRSCHCYDSFIKSHIPDIFTRKQLAEWRKRTLRWMILFYMRFSSGRGKKETRRREQMRKDIILEGRRIGIEKCGPASRIAYDIVLLCPWLLRFAFSVYVHVKRIARSEIFFNTDQ